MKKLIFIILLVPTILGAQSLDPSWFHQTGVNYIEYVDYDSTIEDPGGSGVDQEWFFMDINPEPFVRDSIVIAPAEEGEFSDNYPDAFACKKNFGTFFYEESYYRMNEEKVEQISYVQVAGDTLFIPLRFTIIEDNFSLGDTLLRSDDGDSFFVFDGIGTLATPENVFENAIRIQLHVKSTDFITYMWYQDNLSHLVLEIAPRKFDPLFGDFFGFVKHTKNYTEPNISSVKNTNDLDGIEAKIVEGELVLENNTKEHNLGLNLYDRSGRVLYESTEEVLLGENRYELGNLTKGEIVILFIWNQRSNSFSTHKIHIQ